jgi:large subunit ribosomal protein L10
MPLTRQQKEERVAQTTNDLKEAVSCVFMGYDGLNVTDLEELRGLLYEQGARLRVLPKRLLRLVMKNIALDFDPTQVAGQIAVVWGNDAIAPAKVIHTFARKRSEIMWIVAGAMAGTLLEQKQVIALAQLPGREQLLGQLLNVISSPMRGLIVTLSGVQRNFVYALKAIAEKKPALAPQSSQSDVG